MHNEYSASVQGSRWATKRDLEVVELRTALRLEKTVGKIARVEDGVEALSQKVETRLARSAATHLYHIYGLAVILLGAMAVLAAVVGWQ